MIAQPRNAPLLAILIASVGLLLDSGTPARALYVVATVSLSIWAILEVVRGDSPFGRVLGGVLLAVVIVGLGRR